MKTPDIVSLRLHNQRLAEPGFTTPAEVVSWLGAVQSQDYTGAKWALGMRTPSITDADVDRAFAAGAVLRTHVMRPTWHFVAPEDIRWLLALTAPRVHAASAYQYRKLELDDSIFARSNYLFAEALQGGKQLTRQELATVLHRAGIATLSADSLLRITYIVMHAELDAVLCSGAKQGKQFTYALLDERAPQARNLPRTEALAELTRQYFTSHGPALLKDFTWWSGLTTADARAGIDIIGSELISEIVDGQTYWLSPSTQATPVEDKNSMAYLLPNYDEYMIGYTDRDAILAPGHARKLELLFPHWVVVDGQVVGSWKRTISKQGTEVSARLFTSMSDAQESALDEAATRYSRFLGTPVTLQKSKF